MEESPTRNITIFKSDGRVLRASIPADAKVTFGPLTPGRGGPSFERLESKQDGMYLRVYKTQNQQMMVVPGVSSFIDESVQLEELVYDSRRGTHWVPADDNWWTQEKARRMKHKLNPSTEESLTLTQRISSGSLTI